MSGERQGDSLEAPDGFKTIPEAIVRVAEGGDVSREKARVRIERAIPEGRMRLLTLRGLETVECVPGMAIDWTASTVQRPGDPISVVWKDGPGSSFSMRQIDSGTPVVIDEDDIERLIAELAPTASPMPPVLAQAPPAGADPNRRRGGRPPEFDWDRVYGQLRRRVLQYGMPENSAVLVFEVIKLLGDDAPTQRTVERKVAKWWPELVQFWEELTGPCEIVPASNKRHFQNDRQ
jgi:hypothetical protein